MAANAHVSEPVNGSWPWARTPCARAAAGAADGDEEDGLELAVSPATAPVGAVDGLLVVPVLLGACWAVTGETVGVEEPCGV
jgi:hypothetical protein